MQTYQYSGLWWSPGWQRSKIINSWKMQWSIYFFFCPYESIFLAIALPEKGKARMFVWCLTDNAAMTMHLMIKVTPSGLQWHVSWQRRQKSISSGKPILRFSKINNQTYRPIGRVRHIFSVQLYTGGLWLSPSILICLQIITSGSSAGRW